MTKWTRAHVLAAVRRYFPDKEAAGILKLLDQYEEGEGRERIQVAILKVSTGDLDRLRHNIEVARKDYRDVLWWSEVPVSPDDNPLDGSPSFETGVDSAHTVSKPDRHRKRPES
jgi:hypothetical protein